MIQRIDHVGIATADTARALRTWADALGLPVTHTEVLAEQGVRATFVDVGPSRLELLEPLTPDSPVGKFLEKRGEGIHHICLATDDIVGTLARLKALGYELIDEHPRRGAHGKLVAFVHPKSTGGVLLELAQAESVSQ